MSASELEHKLLLTMVPCVVKAYNLNGCVRRLLILSSEDEVLRNEDTHVWCFHGTSLSTAYKVFFSMTVSAQDLQLMLAEQESSSSGPKKEMHR